MSTPAALLTGAFAATPAAPPAGGDWTAQLLQLGLGPVLAIALLGIAVSLLLMAFAIRLACRVVGEDVPGFGRAFAIAAVQMVAGIVVGAVLGVAAALGAIDAALPAFQGVQILATVGVNVLVLQAMLALGLGRAFAIGLLSTLLMFVLTIAVGLALMSLLGAPGGAG